MTARPLLLVTGFGPFPGVPDNPSGAVVSAIAGLSIKGVDAQVLETRWTVGDGLAERAAAARCVLMFGVAPIHRMRYERAALSGAAHRPDVAGRLPTTPPSRWRYSAFDVPQLVVAARAAGHTITLSHSPGQYICNAAYNAALSTNANTLFVHIPAPVGRSAISMDAVLSHAMWLMRTLPGAPLRGLRRT
ncbi:MAG: hypothetical protein AAGJ94_04940 [Pseudomonadota bacterium]